jgi:acetyl-CoA decarbonylase/synthase complex subunit delta
MVEVPIPREKWTGKIGVLELGASAEKGGSRGKTILVGGSNGMPFLSYEGVSPHRQVIAGEVMDTTDELPKTVQEFFGEAVNDPVQWAKAWVEKYHAEIICLKLLSTNPEEANVSPEAAAETVKKVLAAVDVPLIIYGCGQEEKDAKTLEAVSNIAPKERLLLGYAEEGHYKSISAASMANDHPLIAFSNLDINLAKQITILLTDFGVKKENVAMDPLMAGLGMGLDYSYSVNERIRLAALMGDGMLQQPMLCDSTASWKSPEATDQIVGYGDAKERGVWWEATTAMAALVSGADILIMRHPRAADIVREALADLRGGN